MRRIFITGISGQLGSYLAKHLVAEGHAVFGVARWGSNLWRLDSVKNKVAIYRGDLTSPDLGLKHALRDCNPDEIYHLAAHLPAPDLDPVSVTDITATATVRLFEAVKESVPKAKVFVALSAEMFDASDPSPKNESSPFLPRSAYAVAKVASYYTARKYRDVDGLRVYTGTLFNNDSEVRDAKFFTRKVTKSVAAIEAGKQDRLALGNLGSMRDRGHAEDYAKACARIVSCGTPDDFVIATGKLHSSEDFVRLAFERAGLNWKHYVDYDPSLMLANDPSALVGDASKAKRLLGWEPETTFERLVERMVDADLERVGLR